MFSNIIKNMKSSKTLMVSLAATLLVPTLYAGTFYKLSKDPLAKVRSIKVGVVNKDKEINYNNNRIAVGAELENKLKENKSVDWQFVDSDYAEKELRDGDYSMVVYIPEDFSKNSTTLFSTSPEKMNITFKTNYSKSKNGETMMKTVASKLSKIVQEEVSKSYTEALFSNLKTIRDGFSNAKDGSSKITAGLEQFKTKGVELQDGVTRLSNGSEQLNKGINSYTNGVVTLDSGVAQTKDGTIKLVQGSSKIDEVFSLLLENNEKLLQGTSSLTTGLWKLNGGLTEMKLGSDDFLRKGQLLVAGIEKINKGALQLNEKSQTLVNASNDLSNGVIKVKNGTEELLLGLQSLEKSIPTNEQLEFYDNKISALVTGVEKIQALKKHGNTEIKNSLINIQSDMESLKKVAANVSQNLVQTNAYKKLSDDDKKEIQEAINNSLLKNLQPLVSNMKNSLTVLSSELSVLEKDTSVNTINISELGKLHQLVAGYKQIDLALNDKFIPAGEKLKMGLTKLEEGSISFASGSSKFKSEGMTPLSSGINKLNEDVKILPQSLEKFNTGLLKLTSGSDKLLLGSKQLAVGVEKYTDGVLQAGTGFSKFEQGLVKLDNGIDKLYNGTNQLVVNSNKLVDGSSKLTLGLEALDSKIPNLITGVNKLATGSNELTSALEKGALKLNVLNLEKNNEDMLTNPISEKINDITKERTYGEAMLGYFIVIGLYLGALLFNLIISLEKYNKENNSFKDKVGSLISFSLLQSLITIIILKIFFAINVDNIILYLLGVITISSVFTFLISALISSMKNIGKLLAIVILIIQLATGVGLYPKELTPQLLNYSSPFVPALKMLQQAILGGMTNSIYKESFVCLFVVGLFAVIVIYIKNFKKKQNN